MFRSLAHSCTSTHCLCSYEEAVHWIIHLTSCVLASSDANLNKRVVSEFSNKIFRLIKGNLPRLNSVQYIHATVLSQLSISEPCP